MKNRIREIRKEKGLSVKSLADAAQVTTRTIRSWECGKSDIPSSSLKCLSKKLSVSMEYLLFVTDRKNSAGREEWEAEKIREVLRVVHI